MAQRFSLQHEERVITTYIRRRWAILQLLSLSDHDFCISFYQRVKRLSIGSLRCWLFGRLWIFARRVIESGFPQLSISAEVLIEWNIPEDAFYHLYATNLSRRPLSIFQLLLIISTVSYSGLSVLLCGNQSATAVALEIYESLNDTSKRNISQPSIITSLSGWVSCLTGITVQTNTRRNFLCSLFHLPW